MGAAYQRGLVLFYQQRYAKAADEFRAECLDARNGHVARSMLALCLLKDGMPRQAMEIIEDALRQRPGHAHAHYVHSHVLLQMPVGKGRAFRLDRPEKRRRINHDRARASILRAIELEPFNVGYFELLSIIETSRLRWADSLAAAEEGLRLNPQHTGCGNRRAVALQKLDRIKESDAELLRSLANAPENVQTHRTRGWLALRRNRPAEAYDHFVASLQQEPADRGAQKGMRMARVARLPGLGFWVSLFLRSGLRSGWLLAMLTYVSLQMAVHLCLEYFDLRGWPLAVALVGQTVASVVVVLFMLSLFWKAIALFARWRGPRTRAARPRSARSPLKTDFS